MLSYICEREIKGKAFTRWLCFFDDNKEDYYVQLGTSGSGQVQAEILNQDEAANIDIAGVAEDL